MDIKSEDRVIPLTQGYVALVDAQDYEELSKHKWSVSESTNRSGTKNYYAHRKITVSPGKLKTIYMHHVIMGAKGVDHRSHALSKDKIIDNRRSNLRLADQSQQNANQIKRAGATSKYKGVIWKKDKSKWKATITFKGKVSHLGYFDSEQSAA